MQPGGPKILQICSIRQASHPRISQARVLLKRLQPHTRAASQRRKPHSDEERVVQSSITFAKNRAGGMGTADTQNSIIKLVLIGDVHNAWDPVQDAGALSYLTPDAAIFVGDFGEEAVELVEAIAKLREPKAVILGNHDAWGPLYFRSNCNLVDKQLAALGKDHVGYASKRFRGVSGHSFSVVGGRPFSDGNKTLSWCMEHYYGVSTMRESAARIKKEVLKQPQNEPVVLVAHNGPAGLGSRKHDPCGKDFSRSGGDYGDLDLREALDAAESAGRRIPLVVFGHMHHQLNRRHGGGLRNMAHIDPGTGTVFLDCAVVPREWHVPDSGQRATHFVVVTLERGCVTLAENVWVVRGGPDSSEPEYFIQETEPLVSSRLVPGLGLFRSVFQAFSGKWSEEVLLRGWKEDDFEEAHTSEL